MTRKTSLQLEKLKEDHREIVELLGQFEAADDHSRQRIASEALTKLEIHTILEEDLIYPALQSAFDNDQMITKFLEEHHVFSLLAREMRCMESRDPRYAAKFTILSGLVRDHIKEEESLFPKAEKAEIDWRRAEHLSHKAHR